MLKVQNVSIRYKIGDLKDIGLKEWVTSHLTGNYHVEDFMAVQNVSFEINDGDMLGIIGTNGAGKSTLLKAISGIMKPTKGTITTNGNIVALLELGSGFDGNLTIKENAFLRGAMLGYTRVFMNETYQKILDFSELWEFEERPFKQLSTGMQARLAFSIASLVNPDILILDEVLSVGDGAFRRKSAKKMREIIDGGATTILVSHSIEQIRELCNKVLWLDHGKQVAFGETKNICDKYEAYLDYGHKYTENIEIEKPYDYIVVGAGISGAVFAREATDNGKKCLVLERRKNIGGNIYTKEQNGIQIHQYGAHIFHTSDINIWNYINRFADFKSFINSPLAIYDKEIYNLPFNMNTFHQLWGVNTPKEAYEKLTSQIEYIKNPSNLEEYALSTVGHDIYDKLIREYTEKQWGRSCSQLPVSILKRIPLRFTYNNNYYTDLYQGIPIGGYTQMIEKMLSGIEVRLETTYADFCCENPDCKAKVFYTGSIDEYFSYSLGKLEYRSLRFENKILEQSNFQGNAIVNYTSHNVPYTRIIEHKHFIQTNSNITILTYEYPQAWEIGIEPYYPINDKYNNELYQQYKILAEKNPNLIFGGRLGTYQYMNMNDAVSYSRNLLKFS